MYLRFLRLRDWKSFVDGTFVFPQPAKNKNIVLIGARNGYGKTSLLEAIVLCLYGRDGLNFVARARDFNGQDDRLRLSYDDFLSRAFHRRALEQGRSSSAVEVVLEGEEDKLRIVRRWHFSGNGKHRAAEEEVQIFVGPDEDPLRVPRLEDRDEFLRSYVAQHFLPVHLAQFFLFDGEQVQRLAQRDMADQVRLGIEGLLGVGVLRELQGDLRAYAVSRRSSVPRIGDETLDRLKAEIEELERSMKQAAGRRGELEAKLEPIKRRRDALRKEIGSLTGGNYANLRELIEEKGRHERHVDRLKEQLSQLLHGDLALALTGSPLRDRLANRLQAEAARQRWLSGREATKDAVRRLQEGIVKGEPPIEPPLSEAQIAALKERVRTAWESLWHPPPDNCAESFRHRHLGEPERSVVIKRLSELDQFGLSSISEILGNLSDAESNIRRLDSQIASLSGIEDQVKKLTDELEELNRHDREISVQIHELRRTEEATHGLLVPKRAQLATQAQSHRSAAPTLTLAAIGDRIADMITDVINELYPLRIRTVAQTMGCLYRALAARG